MDKIDSYSTGYATLDAALGVGGYPAGRIAELFGTDTALLCDVALRGIAAAQGLRQDRQKQAGAALRPGGIGVAMPSDAPYNAAPYRSAFPPGHVEDRELSAAPARCLQPLATVVCPAGCGGLVTLVYSESRLRAVGRCRSCRSDWTTERPPSVGGSSFRAPVSYGTRTTPVTSPTDHAGGGKVPLGPGRPLWHDPE